ncbi:Protein toll like protein [Argiope bruennichi]|uniref:Protein toll like protein n=1 Tax=Argiope bruennichi TaxID=94029 RepID=A0A8T0EE86_ARGBR|nr:Protein toll like protein [Argiope bruennichi]
MTNLLIWIILIHFVNKSSQQECDKDILQTTSFDCQFQYENSVARLQCTSADDPLDKTFYYMKIFWLEGYEVQNDSESIFKNFLSTNFTSESVFFICESAYKNFILLDPFIFSQHCMNQNCLEQVSEFINETSVKKLGINNSEDSSVFRILNEFPFLTEVNFFDNYLLNISELDFGNSKQIKYLSLRKDNIDMLPDQIFSNLTFLETLDLSQNRIEFLSNLSFLHLHDLKTLNLSFNEISEIANDTFSELTNIMFLYLTNNKLVSIHENAFASNAMLKSLDLSANPLCVLPERLLHNLINLEQFLCYECNLTKIPQNLFRRAIKLTAVDFNTNEIETIPAKTFERQALLKHVRLFCNKLNAIPDFKNKSYLASLHLYQNKILSLNRELSKEAPSLAYLNVSENKIQYLSDDHVSNFNDLEIFDLSKNEIDIVHLGSVYVNIRRLYLSNNSISLFDVQWPKLVTLEVLEMNYNHITVLELPPCIPSVKQTVTFSFQYNEISRLNMTALMADESRIRTDRTMAGCLFNGMSKNFVDISHNPLICDCELYPFYTYLKQTTGIILDTFLNQENVTCSKPVHLQNKPVIRLQEDEFSCSIEANCPLPCTCGIRAKDNKTFVNCSGTKMNEVPPEAPNQTYVLYFNKNHLKNMNSLNNPSWQNLIEIHADYNKITTLEDWKVPENLHYLSLKGNEIKNLPKSLTDFITNQSDFQFYFADNFRKCNCSNRMLKKFLKDNKAFVKDIDDIVCEIENNGTITVLPLYTIPDSMLCSIPIVLGFDPTVTVLSLCAGFIFLIALLLFYYKQRQLILSFLYIHCDEVFQCCFEENDSDDDKVFDAFVAYSSCDRDIMLELLKELEEKEPHFQLCIHERNWLPGRFISDNIMNSVQSSKRTIVILSNNFIASPWFRLELRAAIFEVSGDKKNKLIVILADKSTSLDGIDTEIRHVISKRTYLVWGERWFWEKLRYAMPRKSCLENEEYDKIEDFNPQRRNSDIALMENV